MLEIASAMPLTILRYVRFILVSTSWEMSRTSSLSPSGLMRIIPEIWSCVAISSQVHTSICATRLGPIRVSIPVRVLRRWVQRGVYWLLASSQWTQDSDGEWLASPGVGDVGTYGSRRKRNRHSSTSGATVCYSLTRPRIKDVTGDKLIF